MCGIIPARAGFTQDRGRIRIDDRDHPRSRGVYDGGVELRLVVGGIIPARAGFTISPFPGRRRGEDHPRSRGVYPVTWWGPCSTWGSSPLARGLLRSIRGQYRGAGIIPARAGFTATGTTAPYSDTDHPRSRGVYRRPAALRMPTAGSSPLARGLRQRGLHAAVGRGIIPARAGFTGDITAVGARMRDHPRSRGVYAADAEHRLCEHGSSPLARGLPTEFCPTDDGGRIIPARAGFTGRQMTASRPRMDHPRSRGVYAPTGMTAPR